MNLDNLNNGAVVQKCIQELNKIISEVKMEMEMEDCSLFFAGSPEVALISGRAKEKIDRLSSEIEQWALSETTAFIAQSCSKNLKVA